MSPHTLTCSQLAYDLSCFEAKHGGAIGTAALATFLSNRLYLYRLQPVYALNLVAGLNALGETRTDAVSMSYTPPCIIFSRT
jgi:20S proteasome alpha/beta subunit